MTRAYTRIPTRTHTHTHAHTPTNIHALRKDSERATICVFVQQRASSAHAANAFCRMMAKELLENNHCRTLVNIVRKQVNIVQS